MEEFEKLRHRYIKAKEYFSTKYDTDTPENKAKAEAAFKELESRLNDEFEKIRHKSVEYHDGFEHESFYKVVGVDCYTVSRKIVIRMELPEWMKYANVVEGHCYDARNTYQYSSILLERQNLQVL